MKILILDDEPFELRLLELLLRGLGFPEVTTCEDPRGALVLVEREGAGIDLILCDLQMPDMDGVEFLRQLRQRNYGGDLILVSGEEERILQSVERLARAHQLHILGALRKPVAREALDALLQLHQDPSQAPPVSNRNAYTESELRVPIAVGELINCYQPIVGLATGRVMGVEALVRWQHPRDGMVFPDEFVPLTEEYGLIGELTQIVLSEALRETVAWLGSGLDLKISVNVSMDVLATVEFANFVMGEIERFRLPPANLILEVTESRLMQDLRAPLDVLNRLRLRRIGLSIDDFGTGHSSLAQLRDIPFTELKIDRSFVHGAHRDASLRAIVEASLGMARHLAMTTVGEGVEDRADWEYLKAVGCDFAQGYFLAKPLPGAEIPDWVADWERRRKEDLSFAS